MVKAWRETVVIPTYEVGAPEKNPIFLEKRVYQGSSGVVYPYPVIESISNEKTDKEYAAVFIENEYIKVMILPELGGRVQMAYDKIEASLHLLQPCHKACAGRPCRSVDIRRNRVQLAPAPQAEHLHADRQHHRGECRRQRDRVGE